MEIKDNTQTLFLKPSEAHIWLVDLKHPSTPHPDWERFLSAEEIARSKKFIADRDRNLFVARRWILRKLLSHYCGMDPTGFIYQTNPYGKLSLNSHPISFNHSKSGNRIAFGFTMRKDIGVDIEQVRPLPDLPLMAKRWFSQEEQDGLAALAPEVQLEAFYHTWTQKESFIKAQGMGLSLPLKDFSVSVDPDKPGRLMSIKGNLDEHSEWKMACFKPEAAWRVAVCVRAEDEVDFIVRTAEETDFVQKESS
jgi:4'-phosphopantetheinyl transferase